MVATGGLGKRDGEDQLGATLQLDRNKMIWNANTQQVITDNNVLYIPKS